MSESGEDGGSDFLKVGEFQRKFDLPTLSADSTPALIPLGAAEFRLAFLREEVKELAAAYAAHDLPEIADALVDIVYVALGTAHYHHLPWRALFDAVHHANMQKIRASSALQSKRGSTLDVVKPEGWSAPDLAEVLRKCGWKP